MLILEYVLYSVPAAVRLTTQLVKTIPNPKNTNPNPNRIPSVLR